MIEIFQLWNVDEKKHNTLEATELYVFIVENATPSFLLIDLHDYFKFADGKDYIGYWFQRCSQLTLVRFAFNG